MTEEMRSKLTPQEYIRQLFKETKDGRLTITYYPYIGEPETLTYNVSWTENDAEQIIAKYNLLTSALTRIGRAARVENMELTDLLTDEDLKVFNTYIRPYEPFEVDLTVIADIKERAKLGDITEEEEELWKRYCMWNEEQSQTRIPFNRRSSADMIMRARRYEAFVGVNAPEAVVNSEALSLAEEMVLYYAGEEQPIVWE